MPAWLGSSEGSLQMAAFSLCLHVAERVCVQILWCFFGINHTTRAPLNYFPNAPSPNTIIVGIRASTYEFGGNTIQSIAFNSSGLWG